MAWTGTHALFAIESIDPIIGTRGHLLKLDGNFENPELLALSWLVGFGVETTRVSHDPASDSLLYTWSAFNGSMINAIPMDASTLTPERDCDLWAPVPFQFTNTMRVVTSPPGLPPLTDSSITVTEANTPLATADLPVVAMVHNEFELCTGGPPPPVAPMLGLAPVFPDGALELTFPTETRVTYEVLSTPSLDQSFMVIDTLPGTGAVVTYPVDLSGSTGATIWSVHHAMQRKPV